jgi:hypothetical protein
VSKHVNTKLILIQLAVVFILFCGGAEAKGIEAGLWGIGWNADSNSVKQNLEQQGFVLLDQWKDENGNLGQKFGNGLYSGFSCDIRVLWKAKDLKEINIESTGVFLLGTDAPFQNLLARFTEEYGQPQEREAHMLKIFPGVWVEGAKWTVSEKGAAAFTVIIVQSRPADRVASDDATKSTIGVSFKRVTLDNPGRD